MKSLKKFYPVLFMVGYISVGLIYYNTTCSLNIYIIINFIFVVTWMIIDAKTKFDYGISFSYFVTY